MDESEVTSAAVRAGFALETGSRHWAEPKAAPASIVLGYGAAPEATLRRGLEWLSGHLRIRGPA